MASLERALFGGQTMAPNTTAAGLMALHTDMVDATGRTVVFTKALSSLAKCMAAAGSLRQTAATLRDISSLVVHMVKAS